MKNRFVGIGSTLLAAASFSMLFSGVAGARDSSDCSDDGKDKDKDRGGLRVVGLTDDSKLVCFSAERPQSTRTIGTVSGLTGGDTALIGIDFRVQDGNLYGVGNAGGVYTLATGGGSATATLVNRLTVVLTGTSFGVDFNPAADRLRIVSNTGQNLRHNVNAGGVTLSDLALNNAGVVALGVEAVAYTNNDLDALTTATTLFDLDTTLDQVSIQSPPNNGSLVATGKLQLDAGAVAGFDIYSKLEGGVTQSNQGFAVINVLGVARFYRVELTTGEASVVGRFRDGVVDIALPLNQ